MADYTRLKRKSTVLAIMILGVLALFIILPGLSTLIATFRDPTLRSLIPGKGIDTSAFDGTYAVDAEASFARLKALDDEGAGE